MPQFMAESEARPAAGRVQHARQVAIDMKAALPALQHAVKAIAKEPEREGNSQFTDDRFWIDPAIRREMVVRDRMSRFGDLPGALGW